VRVGALGWTAAAWALFEVGLLVRERVRGKGGTAHDRGTRMLIRVAIYVAIVVATVAPSLVPSLRMPGHAWVAGAGLLLMWLGLAIRVWAVVTLGRGFRTTVEVDAGQTVIQSGPYRWVRHPAYTGLLVLLAGFGLGIGNWVSLVVCAVVPLMALLRRIRVEEDELTRVLGDRYEAYRRRTKRLVPGVW
jgi:protein-S-isoprenylcysteine O-methyltransferase Ste14